MAGYSNTPLQKKLGIKSGFRIAVLQAPDNYWDLLSPLPESLLVIKKPISRNLDFVHLFLKERILLERELLKYKDLIKKEGMIWVSWPKKSSKIPTELDEHAIREYGLKSGLVDVKICAVDEIWSGLKFVYRLRDR